MCWARRKKQPEEGEEQDRVTGQAVVLVQDNNEALLSLSLFLVFLSLLACFRLSPLFATGCIAYFSPSSLQPATWRLHPLAAPFELCLCLCLYLHPQLRLAHLHTFTLTCSCCLFLWHKESSLVARQQCGMQQALPALVASAPAS